MTFGVVYGLYDPRTNELRYIGQTTSAIEVRLRGHLRGSNLKARRYSSHWLRQLKAEGLVPIAKLLAQADSREELDALEVSAIRMETERGARLTNISPGGTGGGMRGRCGPVISAEGRKRISEAQKGRQRSMKLKAALSAKMMGNTIAADNREKLSLALSGRALSEEHRKKLSAVRKGKPGRAKSESEKQHLSVVMRGRRTNTEEHMARLVQLSRGAKRTPEARRRMSEAKKGRPSTFKGKRHSEATKERIRAANAARTPEQMVHYKDVSTERILEEVAAGRSYRSIADELGVSAACVGHRVRRANG